MLKKIQTKIQTRVDAEIAATVPSLNWTLIKAEVHIEHSINTPCFKVVFSPVAVEEPASSATKALQDKWKKFLKEQDKAQSYVHAIIFTLTNFSKDTFKLTNDAGAGLVLKEPIDPITSTNYGGFAVTLEAKDLTKEVYDQLKG